MANAFATGESITGIEVDGQPTSPPPGDSLVGPDKITRGLSDIQGEAGRAKEGIYGNIAGAASHDTYRAHKAFDAEAATSHDIPDWNEDQQRQKFATDPVKAFGSMGSVFAMVAAAFTHRPMINALQGSAAAMDAIREGDEKNYEKAFRAYKTNTELAIKRHTMMHQEYEDATQLMKTDMAAGEALLKITADKYDDKQMRFLTENGLSDLRDKLLTGRAKAVEGLVKANDAIDQQSLRKQTFESMKADIEKSSIPKDDPRYATLMAEAGRRAFAGKETPMDAQMWQWEMQHAQDHDGKGPTAEERQKFYQGFRSTARETPDMEFLRKYQEEHPEAPIEEAYGALSDFKRRQKASSGSGKPNMGQQEAQAVDEMLAAHPEMTRTEAIAKVKNAAASVSGNERLKQEAHIQQFDNSLKKIDSVTGVLDKYTGAAGLAGKATRMAERVRDIFGSKDTDRVQFMRDIQYLKSEAPQLLFDRSGRPLAAEADRLNDIIGGLSAGDTTANTLRSLQEIKTLYAKMRKDAQDRLKGDFSSGGGEGVPVEPVKPKNAPWANDPEVK